MPCTRTMRACRSDCLHRQLVTEYRDARDAWAAEAERVTLGYATELAEYRSTNPPPTFKAWLIGTAGARTEPT